MPPSCGRLGHVLLNDETLRDGLQSPSVRDPSIAEKIEILHLMEALGINSLDMGLPGAGPRAVADCEALAREIVRNQNEDSRQLRGAHPRERYPADRRDRAAHRPQHSGCDFHRIEPDPPLHRRLDRRLSPRDHRESGEVHRVARPRFDVRDRGHHALRSRHGQASLLDGDQLWSASDRDLRHRGTRHADGRVRAGTVCHRRSGEAFRRKDSRGLARALRPRTRRLRIRWRRWWRGRNAFTPARLESANASATRRWTRCW